MHHELSARLDLVYHRKDAKALVRAFRAGDADAAARAEDVLGERSRERFLLSDAQYVVASEHGHRSWGEFKRALESAADDGTVAKIGLTDISYYDARAATLIAELESGDETAVRRVRANLPRAASLADHAIAGTELPLRDARIVVAREYGFPTWRLLVFYVRKAIKDAAHGPREAHVLGREAVSAGDVERLRELLDAHSGLADSLLEDLTQPDVFGAGLGQTLGVDRACSELLVESAANRDACLGLAACFDRVELVELLLAAGADEESVEIWGVTALETALYHGARRAAELLAGRRIVPSALWTAAALGRVELMESFFDESGRPRAEAGSHRPDLSKVGWPPGPPPRDDPEEILAEALLHACHNGRDEAVAWLLDRGVDVDARPYLGVTGLHLAAQFGHLSTVRLLLERGAAPELVDGIHGGTALGWAQFQADQSQAERDPARRAIRDLLALSSSAPNRGRSVPPEEDDRLRRLAATLEKARSGWGELGEIALDGGIAYRSSEPVQVWVRKRGRRYSIADDGAAVTGAGRPRGWHKVARRIAEDEYWLNLNRRGVVFVPAVEGGVDLAWLALRVADASAAVYQALLELDA